MKKRTKTKVKKNSFTLDFVQSITQSFNHLRQSLASFIIINNNIMFSFLLFLFFLFLFIFLLKDIECVPCKVSLCSVSC